MEDVHDVIIIGAGPAGCTAALYASRARLKTLLLDKATVGGPLARARKVANYPGIMGEMAGRDLLALLRKQAVSFGAKFVRAQVLSTDLNRDIKEIVTTDGLFKAKAVIIASGSGDRRDRLPGEMELLGKGVSYCSPCDAPFFKGDEVAVVGYDDPAAEAALFATRFAGKVYLVCPAPKLAVLPQNENALAEEAKIELICGCKLKEIKGEDTVVSIILSRRNGQRELAVSGVFLYLGGCQPAVDFIDDIIKFHEKGYILANPLDMSTSLPGVYAAGDVRWHELKQAVLAASDGATAALAVDKYIHRRERMRSQHGAR